MTVRREGKTLPAASAPVSGESTSVLSGGRARGSACPRGIRTRESGYQKRNDHVAATTQRKNRARNPADTGDARCPRYHHALRHGGHPSYAGAGSSAIRCAGSEGEEEKKSILVRGDQ